LDASSADKEEYAKEHTYRSYLNFLKNGSISLNITDFSKHNGVEPLSARVIPAS